MAQVLKSCSSDIIPPSSDLLSWNDTYLSKHKDSTPHIQATLRVRQLLDPKSKAKNQIDLIRSLDLPGIGIKEAESGLGLLKEWKSESDVREKYLAAARKRWSQATVFKAAKV
jgi:N-alpha-acetyltransferase 15/16, NatA auxiliary subunit